MAEKKPSMVAIFHILLLLSTHAHPVIASRKFYQDERTSADQDQAAALADQVWPWRQTEQQFLAEMFKKGMALEAQEDEDGDYGDDGDSHAESMLESGQTMESGCWGSKTMRWYHFELNRTDSGAAGTYAVELIRNPLSPRVVMHPNKQWAVRPTGDSSLPLEWVLYDVPGNQPALDIAIDILHHIAEIRRIKTKNSPDGIQFLFNNNETFSFTGGIYYPEEILANQIRVTKKEANGNDVVAKSGAGGYAAKVGAHTFASPVVKYTTSFALKGGVYAALGGAALSYGFSAAVALLNGLLNAFLASVGASATVTIGIGIAPLTFTQILSFTTAAGTTGLLTGAALGLGLGVATGLVMAIPKTIYTFRKQHRELRLSASEKMYQKLECHRKLKRCLSDSSVLVPLDDKCPSK